MEAPYESAVLIGKCIPENDVEGIEKAFDGKLVAVREMDAVAAEEAP